MVAFSPLRPGAWLMRRLKLPGKLGWCAAQSLVAVVLAVMAAPWWLTAVACILMLYVQLVLWVTLSHDMALVARSMQQTTQGDLTAHASLQGHDEMAEMARSLDQMVYKLSAMVAEIRNQLAEREAQFPGQANKTEVVMLEAQLLGIEELSDAYMASVEFNGMIREDDAAGPSPFREVWNMTKPKQGGSGWLVAGVQALQ